MSLLEFSKSCCVPSCPKLTSAHRGGVLCEGHYSRCHRTGDLLPEIPLGEMDNYEPFYYLMNRLEEPFNGECVLWEYSLDYQHYPICWAPVIGLQRVAHLVLEFTDRPRPTGTDRYARYRCRNQLCITPNHLIWSTPGPLKKGLEL